MNISVLADGERLGGSVSVGSVDVDLHLVNGVCLDRSACSHCFCIYTVQMY